MDILCTDKTGTLTQNKIILEGTSDLHLPLARSNTPGSASIRVPETLDVAVLEFALQHELVDKLKDYPEN